MKSFPMVFFSVNWILLYILSCLVPLFFHDNSQFFMYYYVTLNSCISFHDKVLALDSTDPFRFQFCLFGFLQSSDFLDSTNKLKGYGREKKGRKKKFIFAMALKLADVVFKCTN